MRVAMIGTGGMAQRHLRALSSIEEIEIAAHASPTPGHAEAAAAQWGGRAYTHYEALLANEPIDAAWIAVPPDRHGALEHALIERNIPFLVEKPLAADWRTAEDIAARLQQTPLIVAVGYHWRAMDMVPDVQRALAQNPPQLITAAWHGATPAPTWWRNREQSGGQLLEQATHLFDFARYLAGEASVLASATNYLPRDAFPDLTVDTGSAVLLHFDNGAVGTVTATCLLQGSSHVYVRFICEGLVITVEREGVTFDDGRERRHIRASADPVLAENRAFLQAIHHDDPALLYSSYADALKSHHLCWTAQQMAA